jgi:hypothetical protein
MPRPRVERQQRVIPTAASPSPIRSEALQVFVRDDNID